METVIVKRGNFELIKIENQRKIGERIYNTVRYEIWHNKEYFRGFAGFDELELLDTFNLEVDRNTYEEEN
jgi:hypothetical protein